MITLWKWLCQTIADYYFYSGMNKGWNTIDGYKMLNKYNKWSNRKFMFDSHK